MKAGEWNYLVVALLYLHKRGGGSALASQMSLTSISLEPTCCFLFSYWSGLSLPQSYQPSLLPVSPHQFLGTYWYSGPDSLDILHRLPGCLTRLVKSLQRHLEDNSDVITKGSDCHTMDGVSWENFLVSGEIGGDASGQTSILGGPQETHYRWCPLWFPPSPVIKTQLPRADQKSFREAGLGVHGFSHDYQVR